MILLDTLKGKKTERPPVWFMRQAGRVLPSYLRLKEQYSFSELMETPQLASDVTLLPVNDLGVDAAILFSDILVVPQTLGMGLDFTDKGPVFTRPLTQFEAPEKELTPNYNHLSHVYKAINQIVIDKAKNTPLIGFCGAPLTVFAFMFRGEVRDVTFLDAIKFFYKEKTKSLKILDALTEVSIHYAKTQVEHGIEAFQLFETYAGLLPLEHYQRYILPRVKRILDEVRSMGVPSIFFPKDFSQGIAHVNKDIADFVGVDWHMPLDYARSIVPKEVGLQGNLDPRILFSSKEVIEQELEKYKDFGKQHHDWIFNLGHGVIPGTPFENLKLVSDWVRTTDWHR